MTKKNIIKSGIDYYEIKVTIEKLVHYMPPRHELDENVLMQVTDTYKITDHVVTTQHLSFSIFGKDEYQYISNSRIVSFVLIDAKKFEQNKIKLKENK